MQLITKIRIAALVISGILVIGGTKAAIQQKFKVVTPSAAETPTDARFVTVVPATGPRVWGLVKIIIGASLAFYILWPVWKSPGRRL